MACSAISGGIILLSRVRGKQLRLCYRVCYVYLWVDVEWSVSIFVMYSYIELDMVEWVESNLLGESRK